MRTNMQGICRSIWFPSQAEEKKIRMTRTQGHKGAIIQPFQKSLQKSERRPPARHPHAYLFGNSAVRLRHSFYKVTFAEISFRVGGICGFPGVARSSQPQADTLQSRWDCDWRIDTKFRA